MCKRMGNSMGKRVGNSMGDRVGNGMRENRCGRRIGSSSLVADLRDKTIIIIGVVVDSLDTAIRKVDRVRSLHNTSAIIGLCLVEGSSRVVISNSIVVAVGGHLSYNRGSICRGSIGRSSMDSMGKRVTNHTSGTMESV